MRTFETENHYLWRDFFVAFASRAPGPWVHFF